LKQIHLAFSASNAPVTQHIEIIQNVSLAELFLHIDSPEGINKSNKYHKETKQKQVDVNHVALSLKSILYK
jgi:hypothetical protein